MGKVFLLDCTLRDGGYINDWLFGEKNILSIISKLEQTGIEMIEVGFIKGNTYDPNRTIFPDVETTKNVLLQKNPHVTYVGMIDMNAPVTLDKIPANNGKFVDGIRVIFKKNKINEAYDMCMHIKKAGYKVFANFVCTDTYSDKEFIEGLEKFNKINPDGIAIVDTFGTIKKRQFERLVAIADNNLNAKIMLCYHAHNNLQQAYGNAETMVEMNMKRDIVIDACVFGMGRGAGNLNLELFAEYLNDYYGKKYKITPMLEIMDEFLSEFYKKKFWGYSLPLYLSATHGCHPNYAIYLAQKNTLSEKAFNELLRGISQEDKLEYSKEKAEKYYKAYMESYVDDSSIIDYLSSELKEKKLLLLLPGKTIEKDREKIINEIKKGYTVILVNFYDEEFNPSYIFVGSIRRFNKIISQHQTKIIATSNIPGHDRADYSVNYSSIVGKNNEVFDNTGLMALRFMESLGIKEICIAGMDGFSDDDTRDYYKEGFGGYHSIEVSQKNELIANELSEISNYINMTFLTETFYNIIKK